MSTRTECWLEGCTESVIDLVDYILLTIQEALQSTGPKVKESIYPKFL